MSMSSTRRITGGLCRAMGRTTGQLSRFSLNYDLVFLAMMRQVFEGAGTKLSLRRCPIHPLKKRPSVGMNGALSYASYASAILTAGKIRDDIADERAVGARRARLELAACRTLRHRSEKSLPDLADSVCAHLAKLREYELAGEKSVDTVSSVFGDLLADVMSFGLEGDTHRVGIVGRSCSRAYRVHHGCRRRCIPRYCERQLQSVCRVSRQRYLRAPRGIRSSRTVRCARRAETSDRRGRAVLGFVYHPRSERRRISCGFLPLPGASRHNRKYNPDRHSGRAEAGARTCASADVRGRR